MESSIRKRVKQLAVEEKGSLSEADVYRSQELIRYLDGLAVTLDEGNPTRINLVEDERDGFVAFTSGSHLTINWNSEVIWYYPTPEQRFAAFMGLFFHEKAHDIFCDFNEEKRAIGYIQSGTFYGDAPRNLTPQEDADWADMVVSLSNPAARVIFMQVFKNLSNIMDDVHDENALIDVYGAFVGEGICLCQSSLHASCPLFEDMKTEMLANGGDELQMAYNLMLQQARFGYVLCRDSETLEKSHFGEMLQKVKDRVEIATSTDDIRRRFEELNYMMLAFWPFIKGKIQNMQQQSGQSGQGNQGDPNQQGNGQNGNGQGQNGQNGKSQNQQGNAPSNQNGNGQQNGGSMGQLTQEQIDKILQDLKAAAEKAGQTQAPERKNSSQEALERRAAERKGEKPEKEKGDGKQKGSSEAIYNALKNLQQQVAQGKAEERAEGEAKQALIDAVTAADQTSPHRNIPLRLTRNLRVTPSDEQIYEDNMRDLKAISKRLQRQIVDALRDLKEGFVSKHKLSGKILCVNDAFRPDGRCFATKKLPQDLPDMAISVLVDHSGSMSGDRIEQSMKAAMLLYDFATGIGIPVSVAGHHSPDGTTVEYIVYSDFDSISGKDRFRLSKMSASGNNRDGMALNIALGLLRKRTEDVKLLIVISDGRPNHQGYGGDAAAQDIKDICAKAKRDGIEVIAAAIGEDRRNIAAIYKDEFLDISDLQKLPKIMTNIVKKRVIRNAF